MPVTTLTQNLAQISVVILGGLILLNHFSVSITPILTALGVGGLAVALALQDTLSNLFGGFYVAVAGQVRLGDYIKLNTGEEGYVTDIGWRCTTFRALAHNLIIVPNAKLAQAIVTNYYLPEKRMSASFAVTVGYECDPDAVEQVLAEVLTQAAGEVPGMLEGAGAVGGFRPRIWGGGMGFTANFHVAEFANQFPVRNELRKRVLRRFRAEGIGIPYPSRTVYLPLNQIAEVAHELHVVLVQRTLPDLGEVLLELLQVARRHQTHVDRGVGKHEAVAHAGGGQASPLRISARRAEQPGPASCRETHHGRVGLR